MGQTRSKLHKILSFLTPPKTKQKQKQEQNKNKQTNKQKNTIFFYNHSWQRVNEMLEDVSVA